MVKAASVRRLIKCVAAASYLGVCPVASAETPSSKSESVTVCELAQNFEELRRRPVTLRAVLVAPLYHGISLIDNRCAGTYFNVVRATDAEDPSVDAFFREQVYGNITDSSARIFLVVLQGLVTENTFVAADGGKSAAGTFTIVRVVASSRHRGSLDTAVVPGS